jgi:hypothetical protein
MEHHSAPSSVAVGVIGLAEIGQAHVAGVRRARAGRLVAVADTEVALLRPFEADGVRTYPDAGELIADPQVGTVSVSRFARPAASLWWSHANRRRYGPPSARNDPIRI